MCEYERFSGNSIFAMDRWDDEPLMEQDNIIPMEYNKIRRGSNEYKPPKVGYGQLDPRQARRTRIV